MSVPFDLAADKPGLEQRARQELERLGQLWQSLRSALHGIDRTVRLASGERQLSLAHWLVLLQLDCHSPMPQSELRQQLAVDSGFLTRLLDQLDARRLVQRERGSADRRQMRLQITAAGRSALCSLLAGAGGSHLLASASPRASAASSGSLPERLCPNRPGRLPWRSVSLQPGTPQRPS